MKVESVREINIEKLISELENKSAKTDPKSKFYEVTVNKQLLIDAADALRQYHKNEESNE